VRRGSFMGGQAARSGLRKDRGQIPASGMVGGQPQDYPRGGPPCGETLALLLAEISARNRPARLTGGVLAHSWFGVDAHAPEWRHGLENDQRAPRARGDVLQFDVVFGYDDLEPAVVEAEPDRRGRGGPVLAIRRQNCG
jgi:hypothetical protein